MASCAAGSGGEVRRLARIVQRNNPDLSGEVFLEGHACRADRFGDGVLLVFGGQVAFATQEALVHCIYAVQDVRVVPSVKTTLLLQLDDDQVRCDGMPTDEIGRLIHFLRARMIGMLDDRLAEALQRLPLDHLYARALMRFPQHHHDLWNTFGRHTVLHPPPDRPHPDATLPGDAAPEYPPGFESSDTDYDAVVGFHRCGAVQVLAVEIGQESREEEEEEDEEKDEEDLPVLENTYEEIAVCEVNDDMMMYITTNALCIAGPSQHPLPLQLEWNMVLTVNEWSLPPPPMGPFAHDTEEPAIRITVWEASEGDGELQCYIFAGFEEHSAYQLALEECQMAWARRLNCHYNNGEVFPVFDDSDLMNLVQHFCHLDTDGYGLMPKESLLDGLREVEEDKHFVATLWEMFGSSLRNRVDELEVFGRLVDMENSLLFREFLVAMRTLAGGSTEEKCDLLFRMFDYNKQGWFVYKEFRWVVAVLDRPFEPLIRAPYLLSDFTRWLFEEIDGCTTKAEEAAGKKRKLDGYITRDEFFAALSENEDVRNAFTALGLAPCRRLETLHFRQKGDRFIAFGHPHWKLCCKVMAGIQATIFGAAGLGPLWDEENEYEEMVSYDVSTGDPYEDPDDGDGEGEGPQPIWKKPPEWAKDFHPGCRVVVEGLQNRPEFNNERGTVVGLDVAKGALRVKLDSQNTTNMLRPANLRNHSKNIRRTYTLPVPLGEGIGIRYERLDDGLSYVAEVHPGSAAGRMKVPIGAVIEYFDGELVQNKEEFTNAMDTWLEQHATELELGCIISIDYDEPDVELTVGTRVEVTGLHTNQSFNGKHGTVTTAKDGEGTLNVRLDGEETQTRLAVQNLLPLVDSKTKTYKLQIPPTKLKRKDSKEKEKEEKKDDEKDDEKKDKKEEDDKKEEGDDKKDKEEEGDDKKDKKEEGEEGDKEETAMSRMGFEYERKDDGPLYVSKLVPGGPAEEAGMPLMAALDKIDGKDVPDAEALNTALSEWKSANAEEGGTELVIVANVMGPRHGGRSGRERRDGSRSGEGEEDEEDEEEEESELPDQNHPANMKQPQVGPDGEVVVITEYAPRVFAELRARAGLADDDMLHAIGIGSVKAGLAIGALRSLLEMQPGEFWFSSHDHQLVVKGLAQHDAERLLQLLPEYREYLTQSTDTLLTRYFGLYSLLYEGEDVYFAVLDGGFAVPHKEFSATYFLRVGKRQKESKGGWGRRRIALAPLARQSLLEQLEEDAGFLLSIGAVDYAFMIGVHSTQGDIEGGAVGGGEDVLMRSKAMFLGNRCWNRRRLLERLRVPPDEHPPPAFPSDHFESTPAEVQEREQQRKAIVERATARSRDDGQRSPREKPQSPLRMKLAESIAASPISRRLAKEGGGEAFTALDTVDIRSRRESRASIDFARQRSSATATSSASGVRSASAAHASQSRRTGQRQWHCVQCGTVNSMARTRQRSKPGVQPACAGCYARMPVASGKQPRGVPLQPRRGGDPHADPTVTTESAVAEEEEEEGESVTATEDSGRWAGPEEWDDPFAGPGAPSPPLSPQLETRRPGVPFDPSAQRGRFRSCFQKFFGGTPGLLYTADDPPTGYDAPELTEILHFGMIDILACTDDEGGPPRPPRRGVPLMSGDEEVEWYHDEFVEYVHSCIPD